jgi:PTH1 family peptidyl-tRNA hydrolase
LDKLAAHWGCTFKTDKQRKGELAAGPGVLLVKPTTFMNESGQCVGQLMRFFKLDPRSIFVVHDEVDFPLGVIKLREKGSAGGHNGIKSLIAHLGTQEFSRLRFGIGQPFGKEEMIGHVLGKFRPDERELLEIMVGKSVDAILYTMQHGITKAGNIFNTSHQGLM